MFKKSFRVITVFVFIAVIQACNPYNPEDIGKRFGDKGIFNGYMWNTYYYLAEEDNYDGDVEVNLFNSKCKVIKGVSKQFNSDLCVQGSGRLSDNRIVSFATECDCAASCPLTGARICYDVLDENIYPWGRGSRGTGVQPLRSIAVDPKKIPLGTPIYAEEWDGIYIPYIDGIGGFVHDGCFLADDTGSWIKRDHYDFNSGTRAMWKELEKVVYTKSSFSLFTDSERCAWLKKKMKYKSPAVSSSTMSLKRKKK